MSPRDGSAERWIEVRASNDDQLVENLAFALEKRRRGIADPLIAAMPLATFRQYIEAVQNAAALNRSKEKATEAQYEPLRVQMMAVIDSMPLARWGAVYDFAAQIAERANHPESAAQLYERQIAEGDMPANKRETLLTRIADLHKKTEVATSAIAAAKSTPAPAAPLDDVLALLAVKPGPLANKVRISIIGARSRHDQQWRSAPRLLCRNRQHRQSDRA